MAWLEAENSAHCELLMLLLQDGVFTKYEDWLAQSVCVCVCVCVSLKN